MTAVTPGRAKVLSDLASDLEVSRDAYLSAMERQNPDAMAASRDVLERMLWDDTGAIIDALRLAAKPADEGVREAFKPFSDFMAGSIFGKLHDNTKLTLGSSIAPKR